MTSNVDFTAPLSFEWKTSYLQAGRPYITDGNGYGNGRYETFNGYLPMALLGAGDFDGDGTDDVLYARADGGLIWRSGVDPTTNPSTGKKFGPVEHQIGVVPLLLTNGPEGADQENYVVHDMDGDGDPDIVQFPSIYGEVAAIYTNDGSGRFTTRAVGPVGFRGTSVVVGNFDGNGIPDLVLADWNSFGLPLMRIAHDAGAGAVEVIPALLQTGKMAVGDFNGDGLDDLAMSGGMGMDVFGNNISTAGISTLTRKSPSEFFPQVALTDEIGSVSVLIAADFNGDGKVDLVHGSATDGSISYFEAAAVETLPIFADWAAAHGIGAANEDADSDGLTNFQEYFSGSNPLMESSSAPATGEPGERPMLEIRSVSHYGNSISTVHARHARPAALVDGCVAEVALERSTDLKHWQAVDEPATVWQAKGQPGWEVVRWNLTVYPQTTPNEFYRLRAATKHQ